MRPDYVFFRETVEFLPGFYLLVVVGGLTLVFIPITLAHRSEINKKMKAFLKVSKWVLGEIMRVFTM